jgi:hypothetical protein
LLAKTTIVQQEVLVGMMKTLDENKHSNRGAKLVTKHALLTIVVSAHNSSSRKDIARALGVHCKNIVAILSR